MHFRTEALHANLLTDTPMPEHLNVHGLCLVSNDDKLSEDHGDCTNELKEISQMHGFTTVHPDLLSQRGIGLCQLFSPGRVINGRAKPVRIRDNKESTSPHYKLGIWNCQ